MLSGIAGKIDRHFIIGHFFPILFFITTNLGLDYAGFLSIKLFTLLSLFGFALGIPLIFTIALFGGILLSALNRPIIMLFEGYPLQKFRAFRFLTVRQQRKWHKIHDRLNLLKTQSSQLQEDDRNSYLVAEITGLQYNANDLFPPNVESVLPTRLGNTIQAFEAYANERYGIEPIALWSRILSVIPGEFLSIISNVRTSFNFLINLVLIMLLIGLEVLILTPQGNLKWRLLGASGSFIISYLLYRAAVSRAIDWGYIFNASFDLYRRDLLKQFGFRPPHDIEKERNLWEKVMQLIIYKYTKDIRFDEEELEEEKKD